MFVVLVYKVWFFGFVAPNFRTTKSDYKVYYNATNTTKAADFWLKFEDVVKVDSVGVVLIRPPTLIAINRKLLGIWLLDPPAH